MIQHPLEVDHSGQTIRGTVFLPGKGRRYPTVLMLHGFTGQRIEAGFMFVQLARAINRKGIATVTFDFRNSGESDGSFDRMLVTEELSDALRMTQWVQGLPEVDRSRLGLLGFSLGGLLAACTVARTPAYRALAMIAPTTVQNLGRHAKEQAGVVTVGPHTLHPDFFTDMRTLNPVADVAAFDHPTLLVQGSADAAVPPAVSRAFVDSRQRAGKPVDLREIDGADHVFGQPATRSQLIQITADWLATTLTR